MDRLHHSVPSLQVNISDVNFNFCLPWNRIDVVGQNMPGACRSYCVLSSCGPLVHNDVPEPPAKIQHTFTGHRQSDLAAVQC